MRNPLGGSHGNDDQFVVMAKVTLSESDGPTTSISFGDDPRTFVGHVASVQVIPPEEFEPQNGDAHQTIRELSDLLIEAREELLGRDACIAFLKREVTRLTNRVAKLSGASPAAKSAW